jgi:LPXTG-motif cell wall-anchored protein
MRRYSFALTVAAVATVLLAGTASAQPGDIPLSGDIRATAHSGNVVEKNCAKLFPGSQAIAKSDITYSVDPTNTYLDVTDVADGVLLVGVIVKGGPAYNKYLLAGEDLHAPLVPSGKPAEISHWFACGIGRTETSTTSTTTTTTSTTDTSTETTTTTPTETTSTSGSSSSVGSTAVTTTTTTAPAAIVPAAAEGDLASTGFNAGWLVLLASALLLGGGALLVLVRRRAARD